MHPKAVTEFIEDTENEKLIELYDKLHEKVLILDSRIKTLLLYIFIVVFLFIISSSSILGNIQIGPISLTDISILYKLFPILFSYLIFELFTTSSHKSEVNTTLQMIFLKINTKLNDEKENIDHITRIFLPYTTWNEALRIRPSGKLGCILYSIIIIIPVLSIIILPLYFQFILLKDLYINHYNDILGKLSFYLSIWVTFISVWYFIFLMKNNLKENKKIDNLNSL